MILLYIYMLGNVSSIFICAEKVSIIIRFLQNTPVQQLITLLSSNIFTSYRLGPHAIGAEDTEEAALPPPKVGKLCSSLAPCQL